MRLGLLATLSTAYESMPEDLVAQKTAEAEAAARRLERDCGDEVVAVGPIGTAEEGTEAGQRLRDAGVYAVVVVPTIATMAATPWAALEQLDVPVVIWAQVEDDPSPSDVPSLVFGSGPVGATAIGNVLAPARPRVSLHHRRPAEPARAGVSARGAGLTPAAGSGVCTHRR